MNKLLSSTLAVLAGLGFLASAQAPEAKAGNLSIGSTKVQMCIGCHNIPGYQASFPEVFKVPKIAGQSAQYIAAALTQYRKGDRKFPTVRSVPPSRPRRDLPGGGAFSPPPGKGGEKE